MRAGAYSGRGCGGSKPLPFLGIFFNFLGFLRKKSQNPPKFSFPYKNDSKPLPRKISGYTPGCVLQCYPSGITK